ncbi:MAG: hypothetical protein QM776_06045 [Rhodocyclaceae bacterium]
MKTPSISRAGFAALIAIASSTAFAGRPLTTEDAGFIEKGGFELESYYYRETVRETRPNRGFHIQPGVGIGFNTQIGVGFDYSRQYNEDYEATKSSTVQALVGKTAFKELTDDAFGIAVAWSVDRTRTPGDEKKGYRYNNAAINGVVTVPLDKWLFHANVGWTRSRLDRVTATTWALAAERTEVIGKLDLAVETYGDDKAPGWVGVAARYALIDERLFVDASFAQQMLATRPRTLTVGLKLAY